MSSLATRVTCVCTILIARAGACRSSTCRQALIVMLSSAIALPVTAQEPLPGPIARAIPGAVAQFVTSEKVERSEFGHEQQGQASVFDWIHVRLLLRGTEVIVTVQGEEPRRWTVETSDEFQLTVHDRDGRSEIIDRQDVTEVRVRTTHGSVPAAIGLATVGALFGAYSAVNLGFSVRCQPSCGGVEAMMVLSAVGIPVAAGVLGYRAFGHATEDVIYRAP